MAVPAAMATPKNYIWVALALAFVGQMANSLVGQAIGPLAPFIMHDLSISREEIGWLSSAVRGAAVFSIFVSGWLTDKLGVRKMLGVSLVISAFFLTVAAGMPTYLAVLVPMFFSGMARGPINPATTSIVAHWFSVRSRGAAMGIKQTAVPAAGFIAGVALPGLAVLLGWRSGLTIIAVLVFLAGIICLAFYRNYPLHLDVGHAHSLTRDGLRKIMSDGNLIMMSIFAALLVGVQNSVLAFWVLYLVEARGLSEVAAGGFLSAVMVGGFVARIVLGFTSDRVFGGRRKGVLIVVSLVCIVESFVLGQMGTTLSDGWIWFFSILLGVSAVGWNGLYFAMVVQSRAREVAATVTGYSMTIQEVGNFLLPPIFGRIADSTNSYEWSWYYLVIIAALALLFLLPTREHVSPTETPAPAPSDSRSGPGR